MIRNQWYAILPSKIVKNNEVIGVKRLGINMVIYRTKDGKLACLEDQCSHRGAALSKGKVSENCIVCPFHAFHFDEKGKCTFIPANGKSSTEDLTRYNVKSYHVEEVNEIIYVWYGDDEKVSKTIPSFSDFSDGKYVYSELSDHWNAHYSRCIENQLDVVHVPFVHHNTIGRGNKTLVNGPKSIINDNVIILSANNEIDYGQKPKSSDDCVLRNTFLSFIFPNTWVNTINKDMKVLIYFAPVDDENTILYIRFYCKISSHKFINKSIAIAGKFMNRIIERQDKRVVITQKPKISSLKGGEKLIPGDKPIIMYRKRREELNKIE